jgi:2-furoyl-CoA dehydrogenase FAD binding subunit
MKPKAFDYVRIESMDEAIDVLAREGDQARVLAGGMSLVAMMNFRLVEPRVLVDIMHVHELSHIKVIDDCLEIGAATTQAQAMEWPDMSRQAPLLAKAFPHVGHYQTRSRGTVCGSIAHADPSSELPLCLALLNGSVVLRSRRGSRTVSADDFQVGMLATAREPDELISGVRFPLASPDAGYAFDEVTQRHGDFAICTVAAIVFDDVIHLGVGGVAERPTIREWKGLTGGDLDDALNEFAWDLGGSDDIHATAQYRRQLVRRIGRRVIEEARRCTN